MRRGHVYEAPHTGRDGGLQQPGSSNTIHLERAHWICDAVLRIHARKMYNCFHTLAYLEQRLGRLPPCFNYASRWQPVRWRGRPPRPQNNRTDCSASQVLCKPSSDVPEPAGNKDPFQTSVRASDALLVLHPPFIGNAAVERRLALYLTVFMRQRCAISEYGNRVPDTLETVPQERRNGYQTVVFG